MMNESEKLIQDFRSSNEMLLKAPSRPELQLGTEWRSRQGNWVLVRKEKDHDYWREIE
jgi:hypothetical protein